MMLVGGVMSLIFEDRKFLDTVDLNYTWVDIQITCGFDWVQCTLWGEE